MAQQVGASQTLIYRSGVISNICAITPSDGELGAAENRTVISSSASELPAGFFGNPKGAAIRVQSNLDNTARVIADLPTLKGPTAPSLAQVSIGGSPFNTTSSRNLDADGTLNTTVQVKFTAPKLENGIYDATAVVTCAI